MNKDNLMIGDWVRTMIGDVQVAELHYSTVIVDTNVSSFYDDVEPVPLTKDILKVNGFTGDRVMEYRFEEDGEQYSLYLKEMYNDKGEQDAWGTNVGGVLPSIVMYVHELQHLLKLAGLEDKASNFLII